MKSSQSLLLAVTAWCCLLPAAKAAEPANDKEITVEAPRAVSPPPSPSEGRSAYTGAPTITTTVKISALYGDLDLSRPAHAARLMTRVEQVARDACLTLDRLYPLSPDPDCVDRAVSRARPAVETIIAAAASR